MTQPDPFTHKLSLWLDHELNPTEEAELWAHLPQCPVCQHHFQMMQQVDALLRDAALHVTAPAPGFVGRFEAQLARRHVQNKRRLWLGLAVLLLGTLFFIIVGGTVVAVSVQTGLSTVGVSLLYGWLVSLLESVQAVGVWVNLMETLVRVSLNTMSQPLFWVCAAAAIGLAGLWVRLLRQAYRRVSLTVEILAL
jgi:anti-sigma factor RsiW